MRSNCTPIVFQTSKAVARVQQKGILGGLSYLVLSYHQKNSTMAPSALDLTCVHFTNAIFECI